MADGSDRPPAMITRAEGGQPAGPTAAPGCGHGRVFRRGLCRTCYRKLGDAGLPIGIDGRVIRGLRDIALALSRYPAGHLDAMAARMDDAARERLAAAIKKAKAA